jgi:hypothetical protein
LYRLNTASEDCHDSLTRRSISLTALDNPDSFPDPDPSAASAYTATMGRKNKRRPALPITSDNMRNLHERHREQRGMDKATLVVPKEDTARSPSASPKASARKGQEVITTSTVSQLQFTHSHVIVCVTKFLWLAQRNDYHYSQRGKR